MTWAVPRTWVAGEVVDATIMNAHVRDQLLAFPPSSATVITAETSTSTSFTDLATAGPAVTVDTLTQATVILSCRQSNSNAGNSARMGYAVSGDTTTAASDNEAVVAISLVANGITLTSGIFRPVLTAGSNTFTSKYRCGANTGSWSSRDIYVFPVGPEV